MEVLSHIVWLFRVSDKKINLIEILVVILMFLNNLILFF